VTRHRTAEEASAIHVDQAARKGLRPSLVDTGAERVSALLHAPRPREVRLPEPVTWAQGLNGRHPEAWEEPLITAARTRERRLELALLAGTVQP
jgi:hypothetical protein